MHLSYTNGMLSTERMLADDVYLPAADKLISQVIIYGVENQPQQVVDLVNGGNLYFSYNPELLALTIHSLSFPVDTAQTTVTELFQVKWSTAADNIEFLQ